MRRDGGASTVEYATILVLVGALAAALVLVALPERFRASTSVAICQIFREADDCGKAAKLPPPVTGATPGADPSSLPVPGATGPNGTDPNGTDPNTAGLDPEDPDVKAYNDAKNRAATANDDVNGFDRQVKDVTKEVLDLLADLVGITDIKKCLTEGDIVACISSLVNIVPWGKLFKLLKKIPAAIKIAKRLKKLYDDYKAAKREKQLADEAAEKAAKKLEDKPKAPENPKKKQTDPEKPGYQTPERGTPEYQRRVDELAQDPAHGGKISAKTRREAEVGLELERQGLLKGPIKRAEMVDGKDMGEFIDGNGQRWDVKAPTDTFPAGPRAGQPMPPGLRGKYDRATVQRTIEGELEKGEHVILDRKNLSPEGRADLDELLKAHPEWEGKVLVTD